MPPRIEGLYWPPGAEEHVERHIASWEVDELFDNGDFYVFPNKPEHPPNRRKVIGRLEGGLYVTAILEEPSNGDPTQWAVVTGWRSSEFERKLYREARDKDPKKQRK